MDSKRAWLRAVEKEVKCFKFRPIELITKDNSPMFGFWKRAVLRNNIKLVHQNFMAASVFDLMEREGFDFNLESGVTFASICDRTTWISKWLNENGALTLELSEESLELNKFLRQVYDNTNLHRAQSFDKAYEPVLGWKSYIDDRVEHINENL